MLDIVYPIYIFRYIDKIKEGSLLLQVSYCGLKLVAIDQWSKNFPTVNYLTNKLKYISLIKHSS